MNKKFKTAVLSLVLLIGNSWAQEDPIQVWGTPVSPYVRKVISVLEEKKLEYQLIPTLPKIILEATGQPVPQEFDRISPLGKIPALQIGSFSAVDSSVIVSYLEKKWAPHAVLPSNNEDFAKALWYEKYADRVMSDVFHQIFVEKFVKPAVLKTQVNEELVSQLFEKVPAILAYLEGELARNKHAYLVGDTLTIADIAVIHHFLSLHIGKIELSLDLYPALKSYVERISQHPSIQAAMKKI